MATAPAAQHPLGEGGLDDAVARHLNAHPAAGQQRVQAGAAGRAAGTARCCAPASRRTSAAAAALPCQRQQAAAAVQVVAQGRRLLGRKGLGGPSQHNDGSTRQALGRHAGALQPAHLAARGLEVARQRLVAGAQAARLALAGADQHQGPAAWRLCGRSGGEAVAAVSGGGGARQRDGGRAPYPSSASHAPALPAMHGGGQGSPAAGLTAGWGPASECRIVSSGLLACGVHGWTDSGQ